MIIWWIGLIGPGLKECFTKAFTFNMCFLLSPDHICIVDMQHSFFQVFPHLVSEEILIFDNSRQNWWILLCLFANIKTVFPNDCVRWWYWRSILMNICFCSIFIKIHVSLFCDYPACLFGLRSRFFSENGGDGIKLSLVLRRDCAAVCGCMAICRELLKAHFSPWG